MFSHRHHLAFIPADERAAAALGRLAIGVPSVTVLPGEVKSGDGRPILCVNVEPLDELPADLRADVGEISSAAFDAFLRSIDLPMWAAGEDDGDFERQRARVRAMIWLAREADRPVGYWCHEGNDGLTADVFLGFGPSPAMWSNDRARQGAGWDESKARGAYTAAMWHIGARVRNVDEWESLRRVSGQRVPVGSLHGVAVARAAPAARKPRDVRAITEKLERLYRPLSPTALATGGVPQSSWANRLRTWLRGM